MQSLRLPDSTLEPIRALPPGARALVVEGRAYCQFSRKTLRPCLQSLGLEVFVCPANRRAVQVLERLPIDLLILDFDRTDDWEMLDWLRSVRERYPERVFIAVAEQLSDELEARCDALGVAAFLATPVSLRTLRRCIERAFACCRCLQEIQTLRRRVAAAESSADKCGGRNGSCSEHQVADLWFAIFEQLLGAPVGDR